MLGSNQPKVGYEPTSFTKNLRELRKTLESNQIPEGTSRLAGGPYRHQGLSSVECGRTAVPWGSHTIYSPFLCS